MTYHSVLSHEQASIIARVINNTMSQFIQRPLSKIYQTSLITPDDFTLLSQWSQPPPVAECTVHDLIHRQCKTRPDAVAVCAWDGSITYRELDSLSDRLAQYLVQIGVEPESFVPLYFEKSKWTTLAILGVVKAGGAFLLLDPSLPSQRLKEMCQKVEARFALCSQNLLGDAHNLADIAIPITDGPSEWTKCDDNNLQVKVNPNNALYAVFTSGSTGTSKCAVIPHRSYASAALTHIGPFGLEPSSWVLQFASYAFDASIFEILSTLIAGGCLCVQMASETRDNLPSAIRRFNIKIGSSLHLPLQGFSIQKMYRVYRHLPLVVRQLQSLTFPNGKSISV